MDWKLKTIDLGEVQIQLKLPADPESLLEDLAEQDAKDCHDTDPYWSWLWDASADMSRCILSEHWKLPLKTLELGCGCGLAGIAGLLAGLDVTFSDLVPDAVELAQHNAAQNGFTDAEGLVLDWNHPQKAKFDLLIASDILYEASNHQPILRLAEKMLLKGGQFWIGDPGRSIVSDFIHAARDAGWSTQLRRNGASGSSKFQLLVMTNTA